MTPSASAYDVRPRRVLLVGWDAADWEHIDPLLEQGLMPTLQGLIDRGTRGNLATLQPVISPMLWNSIASGKTADKHGVHGFIEPSPDGKNARPWTSTSRHCKAIWNILNQHGLRSNVINWWASHPAEPLRGIVVSNALRTAQRNRDGVCIAPPHSVHPPEMNEFFAQFKVFPDELGEEHILPFVPRAVEVDQEQDSRLRAVADTLCDCVTVQAVATEAMQKEPWDFTAVYFEGIDHFCHSFMPLHPPRMEGVQETEFELYKGVIEAAYRFHDMMLERLISLAGPEATVILCSDHGFHSRRRPRITPREPAGPVVWHREFGIFVAAGPGIRQGSSVFGATLLDITPTLLAVFGIPCGKDMDGKPLADALDETSPILPRITSWEEVSGEAGRHPAEFVHAVDSASDTDMMKQFAALGYVDEKAARGGVDSAESARAEARYNLAQVHLACGRGTDAMEILDCLAHEYPWETRYLNQWATACVEAGYFKQACEILSAAYPEGGETPPPLARLVFARARAGIGDSKGALRQVSALAGITRNFPNLQSDIGHILIDAGRLDLADNAFRSALVCDPQNAGALQGLSSIHLRRREYPAAADRAMEALSLIYQQPIAHFNLGAALARMGETKRAGEALRRAIQMRPGMLDAYRWLAAIESSGDTGDSGEFVAQACLETARSLSLERAARASAVRARSTELRPLPVIPSPAERRARADQERPLPTVPIGPSRSFTIVSGLPRSGTSLMMQMLAAGGLPPLTDGLRSADDDNPEGYYEWEPIKRISAEPEVLDHESCVGRAIKCISALLRHLPHRHRYRIIFISRPAAEIARSQRRMIERRGSTGMEGSDEEISATLKLHREETLSFLRAQHTRFDVLLVNYPDIIADPESVVRQVTDFLPKELLPNPSAMAGAVKFELYRNKLAR